MSDTFVIDHLNGWWPLPRHVHPRHLTPDAPKRLYCRGNLEALGTDTLARVAIIGSRASTQYGNHIAGELAGTLANHHYTTVSGGAFGIDGAAHRGALANEGHTVVVLAGGVDTPYPSAHRQLFDAVLSNGGLLVSAQPDGTTPTRRLFLARNRIIAAMSRAVIVVEMASQRSGTMSTVNHAQDLDVPVYAVPGALTSIQSRGTNQLIEAFARPIVDTSTIPGITC